MNGSSSIPIRLRLGKIAKDEKGFDDLDEFWDASGK